MASSCSSSSSSSRLPPISGSSGSKRTRTSADVGVSGEGAMAWEAAVVKREVKPEEELEAAWAWPRPMKGLGEPGPAPFVAKTYEMVADAATDAVVSWADDRGRSFVVWDPHALAAAVLPRFFKHANFASFIRQLNTYGFRKVNPDQWEFANEAFLAGQKNLLKGIRRRRPSKHQIESELRYGTSVCHGQPESLNEVDSLKRDGAALRAEVITLKRQYNICKSQLIAMEQRVLNNERKQEQIITFFVKALSNPVFVQQILSNYTGKKELRSTAKGQQLVENEEQHGVDVLLKNTTSGSSDCGTAKNGWPMTKGSDQSIGNMCDNVWEELDAIPGTQIKQEGKFGIDVDNEEFTQRPCGWIDEYPYLVEPLQFVEH